MKLKMKLKVKYKAFVYVYQPELDAVKTPTQIIKPVFSKKPQFLPAYTATQA